VQDPGGIEVAAELYQLAPAEFIAARDEQARQARAAGDTALARSITKLRRPAVSAWLVNRLAWDWPDDIADLVELGESLREAQQALAGERLRELSERRRQTTGALIQQARQLAADAEVPMNAQTEREVAQTLDAALSDPDAALAVTSGMMTRPLSHVGLGDQDAVAAIAFPTAPRQPTPRARRPQRAAKPTLADAAQAAQAAQAVQAAERQAREAEQAERDLTEARELADRARQALDEAEQNLAAARDRRHAAEQRAAELERLLSEIQAEQANLGRAVRDAERSRDTASRSLQQAQKLLARVEERATRHTT
jgi:hypothetical protein